MKPEPKAAHSLTPPSAARLWWTAVRPRTLPLAATPTLVGIALAWAEGAPPRWAVALATLLAALCIQIGTNLHNDAADFLRGNDSRDRLGPLRVCAAGWVRAERVKGAAYFAFGLAFLLGIGLAVAGGWPIVAIGLASLVAGAAYSGGPRPISHTPYGEVFVWLFFGLLAVSGSYWLQAASLSPAALLAGAILGLPAAAVLLVNNWRDLPDDLAVGRRTLAAALGAAGVRKLHAGLILAPFLALPLFALLLPGRHGLVLALAALPGSLRLIGRMRAATGAALNQVLADTARTQFIFGALFALGSLLI